MAKKIVIIGGGAAGMMSAYYALKNGASVTILEKNEKLGRKIYITGKGRCNVTNACDLEEFMKHILRNPRFMYASMSLLDNQGLMDMIEAQGVPLKVERGERVFPESDHASDITLALARAIRSLNGEVRFGVRVRDLRVEDGAVTGVVDENGRVYPADAVIIATGGMSYPTTGSTGDGYQLAKQAGHAIRPAMPALTPIETVETWPSELMGLSLKNVTLSAYVKGAKKEKRIYSQMGEMLFTHFGVSGPIALTLSSLLPEDMKNTRLEIDLKPALTNEVLEKRILRDFQEMSRKQLVNVMDGLVPHNLGLMILRLCEISPYQAVNSVTQEMRRKILTMLKGMPLTVKGVRGFAEAIITRGGVDVKGINPSTMESKLTQGLYFAGETMDIDATTGGFNLQLAFSTGALAGQSAALSE